MITGKIGNYVLLSSIILIYIGQFFYWDGTYLDTDNYVYVLRVVDWLQHPAWFEQVFTFSNYPFGEIKHWTRLMDIILTVCSLPFLCFEPIKTAVFHGGLILAPLFLLLTAFILKKIGDGVLNLQGQILLFVLLYVQDCFMKIFVFNRPDHHAVHIFLVVSLFGLLCKYIKLRKTNDLFYSGAICAVFLWTAVEGIIPFGLTLIFLYSGYLFFKYPYDAMQKFALSSALGVTFFWLINPPLQGWTFPDNGRLSILHVICFLYVYGMIFLAGKISKKSVQFVALTFAAGMLLAILGYGGYLKSPLSEDIYKAFVGRISEMEHGSSIYDLAYPLLAGCLWVILWRKNKDKELLSLLGIFSLGYLALSIWAKRFCCFEAIYTTFIIAYWISGLSLKKVSFILLLIGFSAIDLIAFTINACRHYDLTKPIKFDKPTDITILSEYPFKEGSVVTDVFITPYVMWYANRPTVASPYHTNIEGIQDNHEILFSSDEEKVLRLLSLHKVKTIFLPLTPDKDYYVQPELNCDKLYGKIWGCHNYPQWLIKKDENELENYVIFEIDEKFINTLQYHKQDNQVDNGKQNLTEQ